VVKLVDTGLIPRKTACLVGYTGTATLCATP